MQDSTIVVLQNISDDVVVGDGSSAKQHHHTNTNTNNIDRHVYVDAAVTLFGKSGLDNSTIGKLWNVVVLVVSSDPNNAGGGKLNEDEFILMTHLIVCVTRRGLDVPSTLPMPLRLWRENKMAQQKVLVSPATTASTSTTTNTAGEVNPRIGAARRRRWGETSRYIRTDRVIS